MLNAWHRALTQELHGGVNLRHIYHQPGNQPVPLEAFLVVPKCCLRLAAADIVSECLDKATRVFLVISVAGEKKQTKPALVQLILPGDL